MNVTRFVTAPSDINKVKETHSDDELNRLLEAVNQNCPTRIVLGSVEKGKENQSVFQLKKSMK
ncbi:hypothetical protein U9529_23770 [Escherichia coli]